MPIISAPPQGRVFIQYKRLVDGRIDEMPKKQWERIQRDRQRCKEFEFLEEINLDKTVPQANAGQVEEIPIIEDELECPICGYIAKDEEDLTKHKNIHI